MGILKKLYNKYIKHKQADTFALTPRGTYLFSYIARKYMNEEDIEEMEVYEVQIRDCEEKLNQSKYFEFLKIRNPNLEDTPPLRHIYAATFIASLILKAIQPEDKQKCLDMIKDGELKQIFLKTQDAEIFNF